MSWLGITALLGFLIGGIAGSPLVCASIEKESWPLFWKGQAIAFCVSMSVVAIGYAYQFGFELIDPFHQQEEVKS